MEEELIAELRKLGKDIRDSGERNTEKTDKKLERVGQIIDILTFDLKMPDEELCNLLTEINKAEEKEQEM